MSFKADIWTSSLRLVIGGGRENGGVISLMWRLRSPSPCGHCQKKRWFKINQCFHLEKLHIRGVGLILPYLGSPAGRHDAYVYRRSGLWRRLQNGDFFPEVIGLLNCAIFCWPVIWIVGLWFQLLACDGNCWLVMGIVGLWLELLACDCNCWPVIGIAGLWLELLACDWNCWPAI